MQSVPSVPKKMYFCSMRQRVIVYIIMFMAATGLRAQEPKGNGPDNVLQYVPYATVLTMKVCGVESRSDWPQLAAATAMSWVISAGVTYTLKHSVKEWRPDHTDQNSFPSGHSTIAFAGATVLHHEFGHVSPWISVGGYAVATLTAADRVRRDRHHWYDVAAGAAIGVLSTELTYVITDRLFPSGNVNVAFNGQGFDVAVRL